MLLSLPAATFEWCLYHGIVGNGGENSIFRDTCDVLQYDTSYGACRNMQIDAEHHSNKLLITQDIWETP